MKDIKKLTRYDFDNMENHDSEKITYELYFQSNEKHFASFFIGEYLKNLNIKMYLGHNGHVYPRIIIEEIEIQKCC